MSSSREIWLSGKLLALAWALAACGILITSDDARAVNVQTYAPAANSVFMFSETGGLRERGALFLGLDYDVFNDPLVELTPDRDQRISTILDGIQTLNFTAGYQVARFFSINATLPLNLVHPAGEGRSWALGDTRLFAKVPLTSQESVWRFSLVPELWVPTGDESLFVSNGSVGYGLLLALERRFSFLWVVANLGYRYAGEAVYRELDYRQRMPYALGVAVPIGPRWSINGEFAGSRVIPFSDSQNPSELYAGIRFRATEAVTLQAGGSVGTFGQVSSGNYRLLVGLRVEPWAQAGEGAPQAAPAPVASTPAGAPEDPVRVTQAKPVVLKPDRIEIKQEIRFAHDSARLLPESKKLLDQVAELIIANRDRIGRVDVEGHTNELGPDAYNMKLSQRRADAVRHYLESRAIEKDRLSSTGYGMRRPKTGSEKLIRAVRLKINRRVEFRLEPRESQGSQQSDQG